MRIIDALQGHPDLKITGEGLIFQRPVSFDDWKKIGRGLCGIGMSLPWIIGDWLAWGRNAFCERDEATGQFIKGDGAWRYDQAVAATGLEPNTLAIYAYVAASVPVLIRRKTEALSWSHHREVAALEQKEQERWLAMAEAKEWSVSDLRQALRHAQADQCAVISNEAAPVSLVRIATDFDRCLRKLEGDIESWPADRRRVVKLDLGQHISRAQEFYEKL
jgi:hypothetical protein